MLINVQHWYHYQNNIINIIHNPSTMQGLSWDILLSRNHYTDNSKKILFQNRLVLQNNKKTIKESEVKLFVAYIISQSCIILHKRNWHPNNDNTLYSNSSNLFMYKFLFVVILYHLLVPRNWTVSPRRKFRDSHAIFTV